MSIGITPDKGEQLNLAGPGNSTAFVKFVPVGNSPVELFVYNGSPEGVIAAAPGSVTFDVNGGLWVKTGGSTGNTGWTNAVA